MYVLNDGGEVDLDLGNYERYLNVTLSRDNNITTGKIYQQVIEREVRPSCFSSAAIEFGVLLEPSKGCVELKGLCPGAQSIVAPHLSLRICSCLTKKIL